MGAGRGRRTGVILILLIIVVLVIGVVVVVVLGRRGGEGGVAGIVGGAQETPTPVPSPTPPPTINVIVAARDIPRGTRLGLQDVTILGWPDLAEAPPPPNALIVGITEDAAGLEQVEGRIARVDILNGQPVLDHMLTPGDEPTSLADAGSDAALLIPSGSVAMAIPITRLSSVGYALRQGDHVDILMSFRFVDVDEDFQTILPNSVDTTLIPAGIEGVSGFQLAGREEEGAFGTTLLVVPSVLDQGRQRPRQTTQLVVDNAIVLRLGNWPLSDLDRPIVITPAAPPTPSEEEEGPAPTPTPVPAVPVPDIITLVMTRQDALVLKYALEVGADVDLALRSALDDDITNIVTDSVTLQYIIDFYNVAEPPRFTIAHEPRIDMLELGTLADFLAEEAPGEAGPTEGQ